MMSPRRIAAVIVKEARELWRDPVTVGISLLMPLVMLFLFGYAVTLDINNVALGVLDRDATPASRSLTDSFVQSGYFRLAQIFVSTRDIDAALQRGSVDLALVIPERFQATLGAADLLQCSCCSTAPTRIRRKWSRVTPTRSCAVMGVRRQVMSEWKCASGTTPRCAVRTTSCRDCSPSFSWLSRPC
jgi:hypothetical protein